MDDLYTDCNLCYDLLSKMTTKKDLETMENAEPFIERREEKSKSVSKCLVALVIINGIVCTAMLGTLMYWYGVRQSHLEPKEHTFCVPVTSLDLSSHTDLKEAGLDEVVDNNDEKTVCGKASLVLSLMVKKSVNDWDDGGYSDLPMTPEGCTTDRSETPSGHAHGIAFDEMDGGKSAVVHWIPSRVHVKGGIEHRDGSFIVKHSGYYYISSQVTFRDTKSTLEVNDDVENTDPAGIFRHYVYKKATGEESAEKILEAAKGICDIPVDDSETTSVVGATFYLNDSDEVFVTTSNANRLVPNNESNHFALYMI